MSRMRVLITWNKPTRRPIKKCETGMKKYGFQPTTIISPTKPLKLPLIGLKHSLLSLLDNLLDNLLNPLVRNNDKGPLDS